MTLSAFRIANFKAFAETQRVPLRPITLVYGANSAGKSSILQALALAHHAVETGVLDTQRTQIGGESIDLGGFRQYVHRRERERTVELAFEVDPGRLTGRVAELLRAAGEVVVELAIGAGITDRVLQHLLAVERGPTASLRVEVFIWDDFHDRFLISNLMGILLPNGFDTTTNLGSVTRWGRLGRQTRDEVQREFDPASRRHVPRGRFSIS